MNESVSSRRMVRFGVYELDLASGELRKGGLKIRLSGQPFQVLAMLLERSGQVVTREELQKKLWPEGTFVDFDHSLNTAINKIREALGDSAENPRFVETLSRRGYRFIASVESIGPSVAAAKPELAPSEQTDSLVGEPIAGSSGRLEPIESTQAVPAQTPLAKRKIATFISIGFFSRPPLLSGGPRAGLRRRPPR
jgi:DNA-binding winged helix-turn-helix (wHTH) protein